LAVGLCGQRTVSSSNSYDLNGRRVEGVTASEQNAGGSSERSLTVTNLNGQSVPVEKSEERVLVDSGNLRVVERVIRRYDANGRPGPTERVRIEERKGSAGAATILTTIHRADLNGREQLVEKSTTSLSESGGVKTSNSVVERPTLNGSLEILEKKSELIRDDGPGRSSREAATFRRDANGHFAQTGREVMETVKENGRTVENAAVYQATTGSALQLVRQTVSRGSRDASGAGRTEVEVYVADQAGKASGAREERLRLREQQVIEKIAVPGGAVETISVRTPAEPGSSTSGAYRKVEERRCSGECK